MTRFVLLSEFFPPQPGGIQTSLGTLADTLGAELTVLAPGEYTPRGYIRISRSLFSGRLRPRWLWLIPWLRQAKKEGMELAIFGHYSSAILSAWLLSFFGLKYALYAHGLDILGERRRWLGFVQPFVLKRASLVGTNSLFVSQLVTATGVPESRVVRLHPMVDLPSELSVRPIGSSLITVCRLVARKNVAGVLRALAVIKSQLPDLQYHIVGDGPEKNALMRLANELGLAARVHFHGQVPDDIRDQLLRQANAFIMVPLVGQDEADVEGLGLVYLQAALAGLPMVASNTGGIPDIVQHETTGLLVNDPADMNEISQGIVRILTDALGRERWARAAHDLVRSEFARSVRLNRLLTVLGVRPAAADVAVVIPAYNSADTLTATLSSLFVQTLPPREVVVVDDGSTDELAAALAPFGEKIRILHQANAGAPAARNAGAAATTSPYLLFLDADIDLHPNMLQEMVLALETHPEADVAYSDFIFGPKRFHVGNFSLVKLRHMNFIHTSSLVRRSAFPGFDPSLKKFQDWDLWLTMSARGSRGVWIPQTLFRVVQKQSGMSSWLPRFMYALPFIGQGKGNATIAKYRAAESIIRHKHQLP